MKKNKIINSAWFTDIGIGYIEVSFDGIYYEYEIASRFWYEKILAFSRYGNGWIQPIKSFPFRKIEKGVKNGD